MASITIKNGNIIEYEIFGKKENPPVLLIMGLGCQLTHWPDAFINELVNYGYQVIAFDNRDIGLSSKMDFNNSPNLLKLALFKSIGIKTKALYDLHDMVQDTVFLLEALGIEKAYLVGVSMGAMIAQIMASKHPNKVISLTSIMSTTGHKNLPKPKLKVIKNMLSKPTLDTKEKVIEASVKTWKLIGSPGYALDIDELRERISKNYERSYYPKGYKQQLAAIMSTGDQRAILSKITRPALVIHGIEDPLNRIEHGEDVADNIPNSVFVPIEGMGHSMPKQLLPRITALIHEHHQSV